MDPTDIQDDLMHELIRGNTEYIAPEFDEAENDGTQFLNLHYHGDWMKILMGRKKKISRKPRYKSFVNIYAIRIYIYTRGQLVLIFRYSFRHQDRRSLNGNVAPRGRW